jgi:type IV pilus assembly protein PilO
VNVDLKNPTVQKIILSVFVGGALLGVFFFTHFVPFGYPNKAEEITTLKADYEKKSTELARARATVADLPRFEAEYEQHHDRWAMAAELLPADRQLPALLRKITLSAQQTGVEFVSFRPSSNRVEEYLTQVPLDIQVNGGYHQVGSFLAELANMRRIITVENVRLKTNSDKESSLLTTTAEFTASAYCLNTSPAAGAAAQKKEANSAQPKS